MDKKRVDSNFKLKLNKIKPIHPSIHRIYLYNEYSMLLLQHGLGPHFKVLYKNFYYYYYYY